MLIFPRFLNKFTIYYHIFVPERLTLFVTECIIIPVRKDIF